MGERHLTPAEKRVLSKNPDSTIIFLSDHFSSAIIGIIFQCSFEYGMHGLNGLKYESIKDQLRWATPDGYDVDYVTKKYINIIDSIGSYYANELNNRK